MSDLDQIALHMTILTVIAALISGLTASAATYFLVVLHGRRRTAGGVADEAAAYLAGRQAGR